MIRQGNKKKVFVGMSGGVDSSVSAALLKEAGYEVTGVFIKVWRPDFMECANTRDRSDSMRAAAELGVRWRELDLEIEYKKFVVDYMISEYSLGHVPNPDVMCNRFVKFGRFYDWAIAEGADFVATGHYARVSAHKLKAVSYKLLASKDIAKDQTYFLWNIPKEVLAKTLFPIGGYKKEEVRKLAKNFGLSSAVKKDSQGLCFVGKVDLRDFLGKFLKMKKGNVLDNKNNVIGYHPGAIIFTEGQRHGFTVTEKTPDDEPYYVVSKNMKNNTITVAHLSKIENFAGKEVKVTGVNWLSAKPKVDFKCFARIRHGGKLLPIFVKKATDSSFNVCFEKKDAPGFLPAGQSVVLYSGEVCLGGGIIARP